MVDRDTDELVWDLFGVRVSIAEATGAEREALLEKEQELVGELAHLLDPSMHVDLSSMPVRAPSPSIF